MGDVGVRRATPRDRVAASGVLASAFSRESLLVWIMDHPRAAHRRLRHLFEAILDIELRKPVHCVEMTTDGDAVALWRPPGDWQAPPLHLIRCLPAAVRTFGAALGGALRTLSKVEKLHPREPHYHLAYLGARQGRQGRGLGSALMRSMLDRCDAEGVPAYLENSKHRNVGFYTRQGFVRRGEIPLPQGAPPLTAMWREPRG